MIFRPKVCGHLQRGRYFAVEDSRKFKDMLGRLGISLSGKVIESFHDHSGSNKLSKIISWLEDEGRDVYVASERGSPIISDPRLSFSATGPGAAQRSGHCFGGL